MGMFNDLRPISKPVLQQEAWRTVVLNKWRVLCPACFNAVAEAEGVPYGFVDLEGENWSQRPAPRNVYKRRR